MPNQYSEDSRRVSYVEDRELFEHLERIAKREGITVGELIRRATAEKYSTVPVPQGEETAVSARFGRKEEPEQPPAKKPAKATKAGKGTTKRKPRNQRYQA